MVEKISEKTDKARIITKAKATRFLTNKAGSVVGHPGINLGVPTNPGSRVKPSPLIGFFTSRFTNSFLLCF